MYNYPIYSVTYPQYFKSGTPKPDPEPVYYPERFTYAFDNKGVYCVSGVVSDYINEPEIVVPKTDTEGNVVEGIKDYAFKNVKAQNIIVLNNITKIGNYAFDDCTALENIKLSESITTVGYEVFRDCRKLLDLTIPKGINTFNTSTYIGFLTGSFIKNIVVEDGRTVINDNMFYGGQKVTSVTIPKSVTTIGKSAFRDCRALTSIELPEKLTIIDNYAFSYCYGLTSISLPESLETVGEGVFSNCTKLLELTIPKGINSFPTGYYKFLSDSSIQNITIEQGRTVIPKYMISQCSKLKNIVIPDTVETISDYAFSHCSALTSIELPESVRTMGSYVFSGCTNLKTVTIPNSLTGLSGTISPIYDSSITKVIFKEGRTEIPANMCKSSTSIIDIDIPSTLQTVKQNAFYGCSKLATINYNGTEQMFNAITVESGNPKFLEATVIFNE